MTLAIVFALSLFDASAPQAPQAAAAPVVQADAGADPDRLYADRENLASAERAAAIWEERLARDPQSFESAWKLSRICYWLGGHAPADVRRTQYERGVNAGKQAIALEPKRPEGHFWMAASMGALAESYGMRNGLRYRGPIRDALEIVLAIDPAYQQGSADRALGRWYDRVPGLFGGSNSKAVEHLRRSLTYNPDSTITHFFLGEVLLDTGRDAEAREHFQRVIDAPLHPEWTPEDREFKQKAREALQRLK